MSLGTPPPSPTPGQTKIILRCLDMYTTVESLFGVYQYIDGEKS